MWWSETCKITRRGLLAALAGVALTACSFTPVYGPSGQGAALDGNVAVKFAPGNRGFALGQALQNRLGPPDTPAYRLHYSVSTSSERVAITTAQSTNRFNLIGQSGYSLVEQSSGNVVMSGSVDGFSSYSASGTSVATQAAERDGYERLMVILADKIVAELLVGPELSR